MLQKFSFSGHGERLGNTWYKGRCNFGAKWKIKRAWDTLLKRLEAYVRNKLRNLFDEL